MVVKATGKKVSLVPTITYNGKKLVNKKDFTVTYPNEEEGAYKDGGTYTILVTGKGNYAGTKEITLTITDQKLVSKLSVSKISPKTYTGEAIEPEVTVKDGKKTLVKDTDYTVSFENNIEVGTATAIITGMGNYAGSKKATFKITSCASLANAKIELLDENGLKYNGAVYTGSEVKPNQYVVSVTLGSGKDVRNLVLTEGTDYMITYQNNVKAGTATMIFKGINGYNGSKKKTYKIATVDLASAEASDGLSVRLNASFTYEKAGCKPEPIITYNGTQLTKGTDYTLSYKNNTAVNDRSNEKKIPTVTIKGKGNYRGTIARNYQITQKEISSATLTVKDIVWKNRSGIYKVSPVIKDVNGKTLNIGTDYEKQISYTYENDTILNETTTRTAGEPVGVRDIIPAGTIIRVTVKAKAGGNYTGSISGTYRITKASIANAKVTIPAQTYTGKAVKVDDVMVVKMNGNVLPSENYAVEGYKNNVNKGTASVTIRGLNDCGGTKTIQFKIRQRKLLWWWNN